MARKLGMMPRIRLVCESWLLSSVVCAAGAFGAAAGVDCPESSSSADEELEPGTSEKTGVSVQPAAPADSCASRRLHAMKMTKRKAAVPRLAAQARSRCLCAPFKIGCLAKYGSGE